MARPPKWFRSGILPVARQENTPGTLRFSGLVSRGNRCRRKTVGPERTDRDQRHLRHGTSSLCSCCGVGKREWPDYMLERASRPPPPHCGVLRGSTPVVSFGHPLVPAVATLGINPSSSEFLDRSGSLLADSDRRLATLPSLGVVDYAELNSVLAAQIVDDCASYFERRPYRWFTPLDRILRSALAVSYFDGNACHLDLVQWATDPLWGQLDEVQRAQLLADDHPFLVQQLQAEHYRVVVVNGRTALQWVERAGLTRWREVRRLAGPPAAFLYAGDTATPVFIGWSCNLQSQAGAPRHVPELTALVEQFGRTALATAVDITDEPKLGISRGTHARTGSQLVALLSDWMTNSDDETIGDVTRFARAPWISLETPLGLMDLNADTRREAVAVFLDHVNRGGLRLELHVVPNRNGRLNKVVFDPARPPPPGWYAYLRDEAPAPQTMTLS